MIRSTEVMAYAIGIDTQGLTQPTWGGQPSGPTYPPPGPRPIPLPFPMPGRRSPPAQPPRNPPMPSPPTGSSTSRGRIDDRLNVAALRDITDESGGRTEIVRYARDVDPATSYVADELSKQYYIGYPSQGRKDGQWHTIRLELRDGSHLVRARKGYVAVP
jgi:hypothetical protein